MPLSPYTYIIMSFIDIFVIQNMLRDKKYELDPKLYLQQSCVVIWVDNNKRYAPLQLHFRRGPFRILM